MSKFGDFSIRKKELIDKTRRKTDFSVRKCKNNWAKIQGVAAKFKNVFLKTIPFKIYENFPILTENLKPQVIVKQVYRLWELCETCLMRLVD